MRLSELFFVMNDITNMKGPKIQLSNELLIGQLCYGIIGSKR